MNNKFENQFLIEINGLVKKFGDSIAVDNISISVKKGEVFGFLGPNGAGKTTTIKMINGLLKPDEGNIKIIDFDTQKNFMDVRKITGYIPDRPFVYEKLTGMEFLQFIGKMFELSDKEIIEKGHYWLEKFSLLEVKDRLIETYSHGMKQKIVFASVFLHSPQILIVDEPMVGLDPRSARMLKDILREQTNNGTTVFLSTHTLSVAEELCDRIAIINRGKVIAIGTMEQLNSLSGTIKESLETVFLTLTNEDSSTLSET